MDIPDDDGQELLREIDFSNMKDSFFNTVSTSVEGHSQKIDNCLKDKQEECRRTSGNDLIKFHDPYPDYPDWRVKHCYTLLVSATS